MEITAFFKQQPWLVLIICLIFSLSELIILQAQATTNVTDGIALSYFKSLITNDPYGALGSWNYSTHFCNWKGVVCGDMQHLQRITSLELDSFKLVGTISPFLGNLTFLRKLSLADNMLHGSIPKELGGLLSLQHLNLSTNNLAGTIPSTLFTNCTELQNISLTTNMLEGEIPSNIGSCKKLQIISLISNMLGGPIPPSLGSISSLKGIYLSKNTLTGEIPASLGNLSSLTILRLTQNNLSGPIPPSLGKLPSVLYLELSINQLSGMVPSSLYNLSTLINLGVASNHLFGTIPLDIGLTLPNLQWLDLYENNFSGPLPPSLSNASALQIFQAHMNRFSGTVPRNLGLLKDLSWFILFNNRLQARNAEEWSFISDLTNCSNLKALEVGYNELGGVLPKSIANLSASLQWLHLGSNQISGSIPTEIGNLAGLILLTLRQNLLSGSIPATIGKLLQLNTLRLEFNMLTGELPSTIGNITQLTRILLASNNLTGSIPEQIGNCQELDFVDLSHNQLTGSIPKEVFKLTSLTINLNLSQNFFSGPLPLEVGNLKRLGVLDISKNNLSGEIPTTLGDCVDMLYLLMGQNSFQGAIPTTLSNLKALKMLDLSQNHLSGGIPDFLATGHSLTYLNLSFNDFDGEVPKNGIFGNVSAVAVHGNNKLCGGIMQLDLPTCPTQAQKKNHKPLMVIASKISTVCIVLAFCLLAVYIWLKRNRQRSSPVTSSKDQLMQVCYAQLCNATDEFCPDRLIGMGSFGCVFKGEMEDNEQVTVVAVKVLNLDRRGAPKSFAAECEALRNVRHRNLVKILTTCSTIDFAGNDFKALVYEFMPNGSLDKWLHPDAEQDHGSRSLSLIQRLSIAIDVASALDYLHCNVEPPIVHCDLKPSNVLLDANMSAHVGDFGISKLLGQSTTASSSSEPRGTIGYVAPEYGQGAQVSRQGDIYSYGILLLEMVTGKRPTDDSFGEGLDLHKFIEMSFPTQVIDVIDPSMFPEMEEEASNGILKAYDALVSMIQIGLSCSKESPRERMQIGNVIKELHAVKKKHTAASSPHNKR